VIGGLVLGVLAVLLFAWVDRNSAKDFVGLQRDAVKNESSRENPSRP
jgi:membrane-associated phospholipid phosphatase